MSHPRCCAALERSRRRDAIGRGDAIAQRDGSFVVEPVARGQARVDVRGNSCARCNVKSSGVLRGPLVFCDHDGKMLVKTECKHPRWRACRKNGVRPIGWHALRHSFASHLAMRGVPLKVVQELLGDATSDNAL